MDPTSREEVAGAFLKSMDLLRAGGATSITAHFEDIYESAFSSLGFQRVFARMRMEAPTRRSVVPAGVVLQPPEEDEVLGLTKFLMDVYEGHMEQQYGIHTGPEEEWRGYVAGLFKSDSGQFMPDAAPLAPEGDRVVGAILITHWMGMPPVAELGVAKDRRGRGPGRAVLETALGRPRGPEEEWRGYVAGLFKGDSGQFMPDASHVALEGDRIVGAILITHWMGMPLVAELGVAKDRRGRGLGRALLETAMGRLAGREEPRLALYVTVGNDPAVALYRSMDFSQAGGQSVTARLEG